MTGGGRMRRLDGRRAVITGFMASRCSEKARFTAAAWPWRAGCITTVTFGRRAASASTCFVSASVLASSTRISSYAMATRAPSTLSTQRRSALPAPHTGTTSLPCSRAAAAPRLAHHSSNSVFHAYTDPILS